MENESEEGKTSPFDTHPPLRDRIAAVERLCVPPMQEDSAVAISLLNNLESVELQLIAFANPNLNSNLLRRISWDALGPVVTIPAWRAMVSEHGSFLQGVTASAVPGLVAKLREIGSRIPDPAGMLLTAQQRNDRATELLSAALALALLQKGWQLETKPGIFYFHRDNERANPFEMVNELIDAKTSSQAWIDSCTKLGIADSLLAQPQDISLQTRPNPSSDSE